MVALVTNFENMKDKPGGISKAVFHKRLSRILADEPDLDAGEVQNLATFIFDRLEDEKSDDECLDLHEFIP